MRTAVDLSYYQDRSHFILTLEFYPIRPIVDLSYHQNWSHVILTLELHRIRPNKDLCGPVLPS